MILTFHLSNVVAQGNSVERAIDWVFSHAGELDSAAAMETEDASSSEQQYRDGPASECGRGRTWGTWGQD